MDYHYLFTKFQSFSKMMIDNFSSKVAFQQSKRKGKTDVFQDRDHDDSDDESHPSSSPSILPFQILT